MIKNIIFDMGNVLVDYIADEVCKHFIEDQGARKKISTSIFVSPEWIPLDLGVMPEDMALKKTQARLDTEEGRSLAALCFNRWHEFNMYKKEGMKGVVGWLKSMGYNTYLCSNASVHLLSCCKDVLPVVDCFDDILFSADVLCPKPQKEIYGHLFERFHLKSEECSFADDLELSIGGVRRYGMDGYCFNDENVERLGKVLAGLDRRQVPQMDTGDRGS